uniref:Dynein regulatory complex subunit 4 n=1 Tax=Clastoptera arizonana TaxID=38151 RepID=A0A1B6E7W8_9HEMI
MPPKKKRGKEVEVILEEVDITTLTLKQLQTHVIQVYEESIKERSEAKFFLIERDKLRAFWEVSRQQVSDIRRLIRSRDIEIDEALERRRKDIKTLREKLKHTLHEHCDVLTEEKYYSFVKLMDKRSNFDVQKGELIKDINDIKAEIEGEEAKKHDQIKELLIENANEVSEKRGDVLSLTDKLETKFDKHFNNTLRKLQEEHEKELQELEERKQNQVNELISKNGKMIEQMKHYYGKLIDHNLSLIEILKEIDKSEKYKLATTEKTLRDEKLENLKIKTPLENGKREVECIKEELKDYDEESTELKECDKKLSKLSTHLENLEWEQEAASLIMQKRLAERERLEGRAFVASLERRIQESNQAVLMERVTKSLLSGVELLYCVLEEYGDLVKKEVLEEMEEKLGFRREHVATLQYEIALVSQAFKDALEAYRDQMRQHSIHLDELGFIPMSLKDIEKIF